MHINIIVNGPLTVSLTVALSKNVENLLAWSIEMLNDDQAAAGGPACSQGDAESAPA